MKIHEYQAKEILRRYGVATPRGRVTEDPEEAARICEELGGRCVVKAQIHAGGRGKGGGVKLAKSPEEAREVASQILGMQLVTHQTGPEGQLVRKVLVEETADIAQELYLSITLDRAKGKHVVMASASGGMDIEEVAARDPKAIYRAWIDHNQGIQPFQARAVARNLGLKGQTASKAAKLVTALVGAYLDTDASLAEINPLMVTGGGDVMALDAKISFDDNALYRHKDIVEMRDLAEENPMEVEASKFNLNYIKLDGNIACMVNGAGLAMATMDIIKLYGGEPANFLDVGGSASQEAVKNAFRLLISDPSVKAVLVNIFGGIARTDRIARGVVGAIEELGNMTLPVVVRLEGTNVDEGRRILREAAYHFVVADHMADAAEKVVAAAKGG
ncbi:MAG TPA: ADP-forming succinate--CoA ligase subunit beta, partial [Thermoanaerobaculia bacterium]|nr:ADP-forming succinate--CoA ligase subunit beta [Thermoanaerobaculia bacterium]